MPLILIIVGITGDLAKRKLLPAIRAIARVGVLPKQFQVIGVTRQKEVNIDDVLAHMSDASFVRSHLELFPMEVNDSTEYKRLEARLQEIEQEFGIPAQRLFYLSVPPRASQPIIELLGTSGLAKVPHTKLLLEKPFGVDLASARELVAHINTHFAPEQVYRIDHYLAKETVQNLIVFREHNPLFRGTWNKDCIERILICANEEIGIEGRANFYEQTGALRDLVQSHLLQLAALTLMSHAHGNELKEIPARRLVALKNLRISREVSLEESAHRGQYRGYREEVQNPKSVVETYVSVTLESDDPRFAHVPITLVTGKMMDTKATEVRVFYKKDEDKEGNVLVLRLQPNEGVSLSVWSKRPGYATEIEKRVLDFTYADHYAQLPEAYEKVLVDAINSDHDLFVSSEEVLESWRIIAPLQETWQKSDADLSLYEAGTAPFVE